MSRRSWIEFAPPLRRKESRAAFYEFARSLRGLESLEAGERALQRAALTEDYRAKRKDWPRGDEAKLVAAGLVLADLANQGWSIRTRSNVVKVAAPDSHDSDPEAEKSRVRAQELIKRNAQLQESAVQAFVEKMEQRRLHAGRFVSIFSLMRDGRDLADGLRRAREACTNGSVREYDDAISPYLQFVEPGRECEHTGLDLHDIWRYFRHTWSNQYTSVPGRSMMFLVRDAAASFHPVIGIGAVSSPIVQIRERDAWIGWHAETFLAEVRVNPSIKIAKWLRRVVDDAIDELYLDDLRSEKLITAATLRNPRDEVIARLREDGREQRDLHRRFAKQAKLKSRDEALDGAQHWVARATSHLFRSKRSLALADLLEARAVLNKHLGKRPTKKKLQEMVHNSEGARIVRKIAKKAKADRVGIALADITVCGAVQPYNAILGGKLVAMLATSPELVLEYKRRYGAAESEIASSMAGRAIVRKPELVFLGTTSLYGVGSSQYNRIRIPCEPLGGGAGVELRLERLGRSEAFGTSHYAEDTLAALVSVVEKSANGQRVNSIFGEGVSPKLRKVRDALDELELSSEHFLKHGRHRIVYGVTLIENTRDFLLGIDARPKYLYSLRDPQSATRRIADWWKARWLKKRVEREDVLEQVEEHTLVLPIRHGARVPRPPGPPREASPFAL